MATALVDEDLEPQVIKQGYIKKKAEHFKDWRQRYFILKDNGEFTGYRKEPSTEAELTNILNNFTVKNCEIIVTDQPKKFSFIIRGLHLTTIVERTFHTNTEEDRQSWVQAIEHVKLKLEEDEARDQVPDTTGDDPRPNRERVSFEDFDFIKVLGKGAFGKVMLCRERVTNQLYAMKIVKKDVVIRRNQVDNIKTEKRVLQRTNHPFLLTMKYCFSTADRLCFVTEYVNGGDLYFHLARSRNFRFSEERAQFYGAEITCALGYLHRKGILYRDLKLENVLLDQDGHIKIADFGICKEGIGYGVRTGTFCGTYEYLAPEVMRYSYGYAADWWTLGALMYEMICGKQIEGREVRFPPDVDISGRAQAFLFGLLTRDPSMRLGGGPTDSQEVKDHAFFENINWQDIEQKKVQPPFRPEILHETDTQNFDQQFTDENLELTPPPTNLDGETRRLEESFSAFTFNGSTTSIHTYSSVQSRSSNEVEVAG